MIWPRTQNTHIPIKAADLQRNLRRIPVIPLLCRLDEGGPPRTERWTHNPKCPSLLLVAGAVTILIALFLLACGSKKPKQTATASHANDLISATYTVAHNPDPAITGRNNERSPSAQPSGTNVEMHNVVLREESGLKIRVRWLRGVMYPTRTGVNPSFDDLGSFALDIQDG